MRDVRKLVPRTPPEGLREWAVQNCEELGRSGLIYEAEYVRDYDPLGILDEWSRPKKIKMVLVKCSCCGGEMLLDWGKDERCGYGFILPDDVEGDWPRTVTVANDETRCPMCGEPVLVNKRAAIRGYYVSAECHVMSACLVGEDNLLALTGWTVQCRVFKSGTERLEILPAEAYVFSADECAYLSGWRNGYSGTGGYFISYSPAWRQPKGWAERWGAEDRIFGLTPELIASSCLPHCKLDEYMKPRVGPRPHPVLYLRLYQEHPTVESILLNGLPRVLDDLIAARDEKAEHLATYGKVVLPEINWAETRPAQMLHLTKEELRMARAQDWGSYFWDLFVRTKATGEVLTADDMRDAFCLGDDNLGQLVFRGPVAKSIRYLLKQCEVLGLEAEDEDPPPYVPDVQTLTDCWTMAETLGRDLTDPSVRFPKDLFAAHDEMTELMEVKKTAELSSLFRIRRKQLRRFIFAADGLLIRPAGSQRELIEEGDALHHCVKTYGKRHAKGETAIFFIRRASRPRESYYTLELDEKNLKVRQNRGMRNCARTPEVQAFEELWLSWLKAGAPWDRQGKPVRLAAAKIRGKAAA